MYKRALIISVVFVFALIINVIFFNVAEAKPKKYQPVATTTPVTSDNPLVGLKFFVDPNAPAKAIEKIANQPAGKWLGNWTNVWYDIPNVMQAAVSQGAVPVFVIYNIPQRDCGGYSAGGSGSAEAYQQWVRDVANAVGGVKAIIILEPDALAQITCLDSTSQARRYELLRDAVNVFKSKGAIVYLDAGHSRWVPAGEMASRLKNADIDQAHGFSTNVSNFQLTSDEINYGQQVSTQTGGKHFVIDTSRNGLGANGEWCNPPGRALGAKPTTSTGNNLVDAFLWIKVPGESDGPCNGGPTAGTFWYDYALGLASRASW